MLVIQDRIESIRETVFVLVSVISNLEVGGLNSSVFISLSKVSREKTLFFIIMIIKQAKSSNFLLSFMFQTSFVYSYGIVFSN